MPGRFMTDIIFCIQFSPKVRFSGLTRAMKPQKVKKMETSIPEAAAVEARMVVAQVFSRSPLSAMRMIVLVFTSSLGLGCGLRRGARR